MDEIGTSAGTLKRTVLNVGGRSKEHKLPPQYEGWQHLILDIDPGPDVDYVMDARKLVHFDDATFDAVYSAHTIEHFESWEVSTVLEGMAHVTHPGGHVEVRVPNVRAVVEAALKHSDLDLPLYMSPHGPITARDLLWGYSYDIRACGDHFRHRNGFMPNDLRRILRPYFKEITISEQGFDLIAVAVKEPSNGNG